MKARYARGQIAAEGSWPSNAVLARVLAGPGSEYEREEWLPRQLAQFPSEYHEAILDQWLLDCRDSDTGKAARSIADVRALLRSKSVEMASSDEAVCGFAERCAATVRGVLSAEGPLLGPIYATCFARAQGISIAAELSKKSLLERLTDEHWWRRQLRILVARSAEHAAIKLGLVRKQRDLYVSDSTLERVRQQKRRNRRSLENTLAVNDLGDEVRLSDIAAHSQGNPAVRWAELMARFAGFDAYALGRGDAGVFVTITVPSRMHARLSKSGLANPKYDGTDPASAQAYLTQVWARTRACLARRRIRPYGFRIAEPQHDGTPHWHFLLYTSPASVSPLVEAIRAHALAEDASESGASTHRVAVIEIDRSRGSGVSYVAKYIAKNVDGRHLDAAENPRARAARVEAWARVWGIRQFQQIGGPVVGVWRELRRVGPVSGCDILAAASAAADKGEWLEFVSLMGGAQISRGALPVRTANSGVIEIGRYGDPKPPRIVGVRNGNIVLPTRFRTWHLKRRGPERNKDPPR